MSHYEAVGKVASQLQSIEFMLRWWLCKSEGREFVMPKMVGEIMEETPITDYRTLGQLIRAYNSSLAANEKKFVVDETIVEIRDALAHGRVLAVGDEEHLTLFRFDRPIDGKVRTASMRWLTPEAMATDVKIVGDHIQKVRECGTARGFFH